MKKQPLKQKHLHSSNFLWYCIIWLCFFAFNSCNHPTSLHPQKYTLKNAPVINDNRKDGFAAPKVIPITEHNQPKVIKVGKPFIRIDSSEGGAPYFTNYGTDEGLALSSIHCSATGRDGNLWFGTAGGGVSRYDGKTFTNYTKSHGLASNMVFSILEDTDGNLWFGTSSGVSKYNGYSFTNYSTAQGLAGNFVSCIIQDSRRNIWLGTHEGGVSKFDGKSFTNYTTSQGLPDNDISSMMEDKIGNVWMGTAAGGVSKYDGSRFINYTKTQGLAGNSVNSMCQGNAGNFWFGTSEGVSKYDGTRFRNYTKAHGLADINIFSMLLDKAGNLWIGTKAGGISKYDGSRFINYTKAQAVADNNVSSILQDKDGNIWFTSLGGGGVRKYEGTSFMNYTTAMGLVDVTIYSMTQDKERNMWFGTDRGGLIKYDGKTFTTYTISPEQAYLMVWCMLQDREGNLWFGTNGGGINKYDGKTFTTYTTAQGMAGNAVYCIMQDKNENLWFGTNGGVSKFDGNSFTNYTTSQGLVGNNVQSIIQDKAGNIWFGSHDDGVTKYNGYSFTRYTRAQGLVSNTIYMIIQDENDNIWIGTNEGASKFDGKSFINYTVSQGLPDNNIWNIVEDKTRNIIWFGTNLGLSALKQKQSTNSNRQDNEFEIFNKNTGYPIKEVAAGALFVDNKGILWAGSGHNALLRFDYSAVNQNVKALNLVIQNVKVNNENISWNNLLRRRHGYNTVDSLTILNEMITSFGKVLSPAVLDSMGKKYGDIQLDGVSRFYPVPINLVLPAEDNNITIDFVAIEPALQKQVRYQYILEGYSKDWSPLSNNSTAVFGNMRQGAYTFKLRAVSPFGVWSQTIYSFKVLPPWWLTWWAFTLYALFIGSVGYNLYRNRVNGLKRKQAAQIKSMVATQEDERKRISRDLHDDVGTKLSALKLFISALHEKATQTNNEEIKSLAESSEQFITEAVLDVRQLLQNLSPAVLEEFGYITAVEGLVNKINETKQIHFNLVIFGMKHGLQKKYHLALYRITQELVNNVLKHAEAKNVSLQIGQRDGKIILMIEDDGIGFDVNRHKDGYGLHNLDARTNLLQGIMTIDSHPGNGTSVLIEIPYNQN